MKIHFLPDAKLFKKIPYKLSHKYKDIFKKEIDKIIKEGIKYPIDQSEWTSPMVIQPKNDDPKNLRHVLISDGLTEYPLLILFPLVLLIELSMKWQSMRVTPLKNSHGITKYP